MEERFFERFEEQIIKGRNLDGVLITSSANMRYCSGFRGEGIVYLAREQRLVLTDSRYTIAAREECPSFEVIEYRGNIWESWIQILSERTGSSVMPELRIGFEDEWMTVKAYRTLEALLKKEDMPGLSLVPLHKKLDSLRRIKAEDEWKDIEKAEKIGDYAFEKVLEKIRACMVEGTKMTEKQVAAWIEFYMKEMGADGTSFDTIAASGIHSSMPHAIPTDKVLEEGDCLTMDFGCKVNGYCSDMTRTILIGRADERQREVYRVVLQAQKAALAAIRPGMKGCEVDAVARNIIAEAGYGECFGHSLGHSVGLEIHESPCFSSKDETVLEPGMVITVEPGIYIEGAFGVRIEDVVVITENGCRNITKSPKELMEIN